MARPVFPYLGKDDYFEFPSVEEATSEGIVAVGGNLSPGMVLSAYRQGIFPWFSENDPILWWSPDPRFVLLPEELHISKSMKRIINKNIFTVTFDRAFSEVLLRCSKIERKGQDGTWITEDMLIAYNTLHEIGYAHSVETWQDDQLVGGLYGISLGKCFFGESMFSTVSNASKRALIHLRNFLAEKDFLFIDCQVYTPHLSSMGARDIPRSLFYSMLEEGLSYSDSPGTW